MNSQRLFRSQSNKVFAGVCGGLAEYFDVDPVVVRILFVLMVLFGGTGIVLYIAAIVIVPKRPFTFPETGTAAQDIPPAPVKESARNWFGIVLVVLGALLLLSNMDMFHFFDFLEDTLEYIFPVLLIILGMAIIYYRQTRPEPVAQPETEGGTVAGEQQHPIYRNFRRSSADKKLFGVCGGLARYFGIDSSLIRMLYVVLCLASFGAGFILYILIALVVPYDHIYTAKVS